MIDFSTVTDIMLGNQQVTQIEDSLGNVLWSGEQEDNTEYFYIVNTYSSTNQVSIQKDKSDAPDITVYYSTNKSTWTLMGTTSTTAITYTIPKNGRVYLKANAPDGWGYRNQAGGTSTNYIRPKRKATIGGNPKSLIFGDNYRKLNNHIPDYAFLGLFTSATNITSAINLQLVEDILTPYCYQNMFYGCTSLTTAPELPATTLATGCYQYMFQKCTSLTTAPVLSATTLERSCYYQMFQNCTSLTTAPALPATTLAQSCYHGMFSGCTALTAAPALPATTLVDDCYRNMFYQCTSLTTAPVLSATTLERSCYYQMFQNCTSLTTAPALPATTLASSCYGGMFSGCTSLNSMTTYANNISANRCTENWLDGVSSTGDFYNLGGATYQSGVSGIPTGWTEHRANCNVSISAGSNGSVSVNGVTGNYSQSVLNGTQLTLVATPDSGYVFDEWSDGDTNATRTITVTNDLTLTAAFEVYTGVPDYHIQYTTTDNNQLSLSNSVITNHTFTNGVGDITINTTTLPARFFEDKTTLRTLAYGGNIEFDNGGYQHSGCTNLESVDLPANMTYIPQRWFRTCRKLSRLDLPVSAMTWNISWPFYYTATQTTEGVLHVYVHNSTTLPTMDYTKYAEPHDNDFYVTGNIGGSNPSHSTDIKNLIRLHVPSSLYNDYITTAPHSVVASCISSY